MSKYTATINFVTKFGFKVMFLHLSVILFTGEVVCLQGVCIQEGSAYRRGGYLPTGCLLSGGLPLGGLPTGASAYSGSAYRGGLPTHPSPN